MFSFLVFFYLKKHQKNIFHILALEKIIYFSIFIKTKHAYFDLITSILSQLRLG
jgi:hypothetical protein